MAYQTPNQAYAMPALAVVRVSLMGLPALFARGWENERHLGLLTSPNHGHLLGFGSCQLVEQLILLAALLATLVAVLLNL